eukprot:850864-Pelagomonas_calceolata.AAC.1
MVVPWAQHASDLTSLYAVHPRSMHASVLLPAYLALLLGRAERSWGIGFGVMFADKPVHRHRLTVEIQEWLEGALIVSLVEALDEGGAVLSQLRDDHEYPGQHTSL